MQTIQTINQSKQIHVAAAKREETLGSKSRLVLVLPSDWSTKWRKNFLAKHKACSGKTRVTAKLLLTLN